MTMHTWLTMNLPHSRSDMASAFDRLHIDVQRWVHAQGWSQLREVQEQSIRCILGDQHDVLISAATAAGKTEAAFLPMLSATATRDAPGVSLMYVAPLKALINDQYQRLIDLAETLEVPLVRWHGDAPEGPKTRLRKKPGGIVLITPESIEAMLIRRPAEAEAMFGTLDAIIVDELHAFLQGPRGLHLSSLLHRIEMLNDQRPRRIGLSATLGDLSFAAHWLSSTAAHPPHIVAVEGQGAPLKLQVRCYVDLSRAEIAKAQKADGDDDPVQGQICDHAFAMLRGHNNLFFANSRATVETLADGLRHRSERAKVPNEFYPHHGSLARELKEELELRLKEDKLPTTAIATTTLELGIDIGSVHSVAQYGAPQSISSLKQRLGRSGRREGASAIFRNYVRERYIAADADPLDTLRLPTIQACAAIRLLLARFVEPPSPDAALYSVTVHQILSLLAERGSLSAKVLYGSICCPGPFKGITPAIFATLLKGLAHLKEPLLEQAPDGTIMLGPMGERLVDSRDFYANFQSNEEWRVVHHGRALGTIPLINAFGIGSIIGFAGRRWRVSAVDDRAKLVEVVAHQAGRVPKFDRQSNEIIHDRLAAEMRAVFTDEHHPNYLDDVAAVCLREGRKAFQRLNLASTRFLPSGNNVHIVTWRGSAINAVLAILLHSTGIECETFTVGVTAIGVTPEDASDVLASIGECPAMDELGRFVKNLAVEKYDKFIPDDLLRAGWVQRNAHLQKEISALLAELCE